MLYLAGISISFFLGFLLITKKSKSLPDKILAAWLFVIGIHLLLFYLSISGKLFQYPWLLGIHMPLPLLHGPFLFLYTATLTSGVHSLQKKDLLHFAPAIVCYMYLLPFFLEPAAEKIFVFKNKGVGHETFVLVNSSAITLSGIVYVVWSIILLRRHRRSIMDQFSYTEKINLEWLQYLVFGIALIWVFVIADNDRWIFSTAVLFVIFIGYFGIKQVGIFTHGNTINTGEMENASPETNTEIKEFTTVPGGEQDEQKKKYSKSGLTAESADELHKNLLALLANEKPFKESELTLVNLAERLNTVPNYLSQIINEREGKNFYDFINTLRIEEFKKVVTDPGNQKFSFLGLAYDCGFNSKSSFNKYFKKITGLSPTEYLKQAELA